MSLATDVKGLLRGVVVGSVASFLAACFGCTSHNISESGKPHLPCVAKNSYVSMPSIRLESRHTYIFHPGILPMLDNATYIIGVDVETDG